MWLNRITTADPNKIVIETNNANLVSEGTYQGAKKVTQLTNDESGSLFIIPMKAEVFLQLRYHTDDTNWIDDH